MGEVVAPAIFRRESIVITPFSPESIGSGMRSLTGTAAASTAWGTANLAVGFSFRIHTRRTSVKVAWSVGATNTGNIDVGVYDVNFGRLASIGATALGTASTEQDAALALELAPGRYYLFTSLANAAGTLIMPGAVVAELAKFYSLVQMAAAHPLPATITPAAFGQVFIPEVGLAFRSLI